MPTTKKDKAVLAVIILVVATSIVARFFGPTITRMIEERREDNLQLPKLYVRQNVAFDVCTDYTQNDRYHGDNELKLNRVVVNISAYNEYQSKYQLTVDEVVDYFEEEYDSSGNPRVYSQPESIHDYIEWYWNGGEEIIGEYGDGFTEYMSKHGYPNPFYRHMEYEDVVTALEEYKNSPEYIAPQS